MHRPLRGRITQPQTLPLPGVGEMPPDRLESLPLHPAFGVHPSPTAPGAAAAAPAAPAAPAAAVRAQPATLLWDYDNLRPSDFGMSVAAFFTGMMSALKAQGLRVTDSVAYLVANKDYGIDPNKLKDLQVDMRLSGMKREQADRDLSRDLRKRAEQLERQGLRGVFVIVSSDKDFTEAVKALTDPRADGSDGHTAWVVHNAAPGSDHELMLTLYATGAMSVRSFAAPAASPSPQGTASGTVGVGVSRAQFASLTASVPLRPMAPASIDAYLGGAQAAAAEAAAQGAVLVGESKVLIALLTMNPAVEYLLSNPGKAGRWCSNKAEHPASTCGFCHPADGHLIVDDTVCALTDLVANSAVHYATTHPGTRLRTCRLADGPAHWAVECRFAHFKPGAGGAPPSTAVVPPPPPPPTAGHVAAGEPTITVESEAIPVSRLVMTASVQHFVANPHKTARWCTNHIEHDPGTCSFMHAAPGCVVVAGQVVELSSLVQNEAWRFLRANPTKRGRWCTFVGVEEHSVADCSYVHLANGRAPPVTAAVQPSTVGQASQTVKAKPLSGGEPEEVPIQQLVRNRAVEYLLTHPHHVGSWCFKAGQAYHDAASCTYLHRK